ncbi:carbohydrate ABC transporter permease [Phytoactinopolyspora mesophila]|uniref:ABC transporter permease subunit n=1 Tax=Phytoactinopolyspora mesophila TaxID=2650750 RepID=A0A7K3MAM6_9ACTN|nr:carbohydrate ABC transporter permease [Phytoactinopolyspora mesophila]NDL59438.1 ABC transporter permease subunit [Phytoactinopolyspora mesophila]
MTAPPLATRRRQDRVPFVRAVTYAALILAVVVTLIPFAWMFLGAFKTDGELIRRPITWWPDQPTMENFVTWFTRLDFGQFFLNSSIVAVATVLGNLMFCSMVGYALAKIDFAGKRVLFTLVLITLMIPGVVTFIPLFVVVSKLGMISTYPALILPFLASPLGVFLMRQFMLGIPDALLEAARIDGAGELRIFLRVVMPLCGPALATLAILTFLGSWNNFLWPLVAAQSEDMYTLPVALSLYSVGQNATNYGVLLAGSVLVITPILLFFVALQRYFIQGIATVGVK